MRKILTCFGLLTFLVMSSYAAEPLVLNNDKIPLVLSVDSIPESIGKNIGVSVFYNWRDWTQTEFEENQNADGKITYFYTVGKLCGGRHLYGGNVKLKSLDSGVLEFTFNSYTDDKGGYGYGPGHYTVRMHCSYKGKDGKKHKGTIGYLQIDVNFVRP
jgi:hypothetical protein